MQAFFPKSDKKLCNILKDETYIQDPSWVAKLCADGKLDLAITRAEENIKKAIEANDLSNQSFHTYIEFSENTTYNHAAETF